MEGYEKLITYKLSLIIYDLTWDFVPQYYPLKEDYRQRDQLKQAARSIKQNISEGSSERSLSSKLKLYDVAKSSSRELLEDYRDILRREGINQWPKNDLRLFQLRKSLENFSSNPSASFSVSSVISVLEGIRGKDDKISSQ
ncbi:MAG TPA: four helix bundle protein [Patescibacteria group bacterium]|nr:four helix bundle protein [Patescibacteria group bacterium]